VTSSVKTHGSLSLLWCCCCVTQGTPVGIPWFAFGHNPATYGQDVADFKPERWLTGRNNSSMSSVSSTDDSDSQPSPSPSLSAAAGSAAAGAAAAVQRVSSTKQLQDPWTFSIGPRDCAGQALARLELQVVIAAIVGNFRVKLGPGVDGWEGLLGKRMFHTTLQVRDGLPLLLTPRVNVHAAS
jgi:cytochrome P450